MVNLKCDGSRDSLHWLQWVSNQAWLPLNVWSAVLTDLWWSSFINGQFIFLRSKTVKGGWHGEHTPAPPPREPEQKSNRVGTLQTIGTKTVMWKFAVYSHDEIHFFFPVPPGSSFPDVKHAPGLLGCTAFEGCGSLTMPEQNPRPGRLLTSHTETSTNKPQQTAFCGHTAPLIKRKTWELFLLSSAPFCTFLFFLQLHLMLLSLFSCWAGVLNEVTTRAALGCALKCCLKRAFLPFPLIFYPLHHPISFTLTFPSPLSISILISSFNVFPLTL